MKGSVLAVAKGRLSHGTQIASGHSQGHRSRKCLHYMLSMVIILEGGGSEHPCFPDVGWVFVIY